MNFGIIQFPGSNCDHDCYNTIRDVFGHPAQFLWHRDRDLKGCDCIIIPGGFSYGDYLRAGAIASRSPILDSVAAFAKKGGPVIGICNGFQVLTETGMLPGALMRNRGLTFICKTVSLRVENADSIFTSKYTEGEIIRVPIAHMDGNYFASPSDVKALNDNGQVLFRYCTESGEISDTANPNGALENIAGICNKQGNVLGMMPHPERCSDTALGGIDGKRLFDSVINAIGVSR